MTRKVEDQARWLADRFNGIDKKFAGLASRTGLEYSSIEDGAIVEKDLEGNLVSSVGKQADGSHVAFPYTGPKPATPVAASLKAFPGLVEVRWSGKFTGDAVSSLDFKHVSVHVSSTPVVDTTPSTQVATIRGELGDVATLVRDEGMVYVVLVAWTTAGKASDPSPVAAVAIPAPVDPLWLQDKLDDIDERYDGVITEAGQLGSKLDQATTDIAAAKTRLASAETDITTAFGRIDTATTKATAASTAASAAQTKADDAATAALAAAGLAGSKGEVIYQVSAPTGSRANAANLWIRSSDNKPYTYNGTTWVAVTDKVATDAAAAAATAQAAAVAAQAAAGTAQSTADSALTMAGTKSKVYYTTTTPSGTGSQGDVWRRVDASKNVIAEWFYGVNGWTSTLVTTEMISNLDVGKLTAGAAEIATLVSQKIAAAAGQFISLDVKQLVVTGTGTLNSAVIDKLWTDVVNSKKITAQMIAVGDFSNYVNDADLSRSDGWQLDTGVSITAVDGIRWIAYTGTGSKGALNLAAMDVAEGDQVRIDATIFSPGFTGNAGGIRAVGTRPDGTTVAINLTNFTPDATSRKVSTVYTVPVNLSKLQFRYATALTGGVVYMRLPQMRKMNAGELIVDGAVTAKKLETELVLTTDVVAGNPAGTHSRMNPSGFHVLASTDGNAPTEVIRMGTNTDDYFGVANAGGELVASITSGGDISGQSGDFATDVSLGGTSILDRISDLPRGLAAWASRATNSKYWAGTAARPYLHLQFDAEAGRAYMVETTPISIDSDTSNVEAVIYLQYEETGTPATNASPVIARGTSVQASVSTRRSPISINRLITPPAGPVSLLISYGTISTGRAKIVAAPDGQTVVLTVTDIGAAPPMTGEVRDATADAATTGTGGTGEASVPPAVKNYDQTWKATGYRSFIGSGAQYAFNPQYMYSGLSPAGYGDLSAMAVFPNLTGVLSGATITGVWIYVYYDFWYQGSGGTPYLSLHGQTALTASRPAKTWGPGGLGNWARASGKWVALSSSTWAGIKSGTHRGIMLGDSGGGYERYGYAHDAKIRVKYTK